MNVIQRNKRGDLLAIFLSPMTPDRWQQLASLSRLSRRFEIQLPNGYRLKYGQHLNILKQNPKNFGQYVRIAYTRYFSDSFPG
jgi:hypothetical protein